MIADVNITEKSFGAKSLYKDIRFSLHKNEKVGLIGRNGVGKSTLFNVLSGSDKDYSGHVTYKHGSVVVATRQEHTGFEKISVIDYILQDLPEYSSLQRIISNYPETMGNNVRQISEYTDSLERFDQMGYYTVEDHVRQTLHTLQFTEEKIDGLFGALSGGQKRMVEIVKIMHSRADIALIDEPTNHMDYLAKASFITWLADSPEAMLVITHDRDVLKYVDKIVEIKDGRAYTFKGNYDAFLKQNAHATSAQVQEYETTQRQITNLKDKAIQFRRLKERARDPDTIKQFKRREEAAKKELAELDKLKRPSFWIDKDSTKSLNYKVEDSYQKYKAKNIKIDSSGAAEQARSHRLLVSAGELALSYGAKPLFAPITFQLYEGERLELRGRNGAGKTTIVKQILNEAGYVNTDSRQIAGVLKVDKGLKIGTYEQEISTKYLHLPLQEAIEQLYMDKKLAVSKQLIMKIMSNYLFDPIIDANLPLIQLSGGQKARFQLISMLCERPKLLILDEPTNHLDLPSIEELEDALTQFHGAIIYVSHDSYFSHNIGGEVIQLN